MLRAPIVLILFHILPKNYTVNSETQPGGSYCAKTLSNIKSCRLQTQSRPPRVRVAVICNCAGGRCWRGEAREASPSLAPRRRLPPTHIVRLAKNRRPRTDGCRGRLGLLGPAK